MVTRVAAFVLLVKKKVKVKVIVVDVIRQVTVLRRLGKQLLR